MNECPNPDSKRGVLYGLLVIAYLFLGGISSGGLFLMSFWNLLSSHMKDSFLDRLSRTVALRARWTHRLFCARVCEVCMVLLVLAVIFLLFDLGRPERILYLFLPPRKTVLTFGAICLAIEIIIGGVLTATLMLQIPVLRLLDQIINIVCCVVSFATFTYTGVFLLTSIGIVFWNTWTIVPLFIFSSLSGAISLVFIVRYFFPDDEISTHISKLLQRSHLLCIIFEGVFLFLFVYTSIENPFCANAVATLFSARMLPVAFIGVLGMGLIAPALCAIYNLFVNIENNFIAGNVLCLCGGFLLRYCIICCGVL